MSTVERHTRSLFHILLRYQVNLQVRLSICEREMKIKSVVIVCWVLSVYFQVVWTLFGRGSIVNLSFRKPFNLHNYFWLFRVMQFANDSFSTLVEPFLESLWRLRLLSFSPPIQPLFSWISPSRIHSQRKSGLRQDSQTKAVARQPDNPKFLFLSVFMTVNCILQSFHVFYLDDFIQMRDQEREREFLRDMLRDDII